MHVTIPVHTQVVNGRQIPKIDISNFAVTFDTRKIVISLGGGILADIADLFIGLFKSTIIKLIANGMSVNDVAKTFFISPISLRFSLFLLIASEITS